MRNIDWLVGKLIAVSSIALLANIVLLQPALAGPPKQLVYTCNFPAISGAVYFWKTDAKHYFFSASSDSSANDPPVKAFGTPGNGSMTFSRVPAAGKSITVTILANGAATTSLDTVVDPTMRGVYGSSGKKVAHKWGECLRGDSVSQTSTNATVSGVSPPTSPPPRKNKENESAAHGCMQPVGDLSQWVKVSEWKNVCNFNVNAVAITYGVGFNTSTGVSQTDVHLVEPGGLLSANGGPPLISEIFTCKAPFSPQEPIDSRYWHKAVSDLPDCVKSSE